MSGIKSFIKNGLTRHIDANHLASVKREKLSYGEWISKYEKDFPVYDMSLSMNARTTDDINVHHITYAAKYEGMSIRVIPYSSVLDDFEVKNYIDDILIFVNGELTPWAIPLIASEFINRPGCNVVYGNEDIKDEKGNREDPLLKPEWSPNTFISHFYFCNIVAIRRIAFRDFAWSTGYTGAEAIYHTLLRYVFTSEITLRNSVSFVDEILVHTSDYDNFRIVDAGAKRLAERFIKKPDNKISVVIPSKNNPHLLRKCIGALVNEPHEGLELEVIVVDNGSSPDKKAEIERLSDELRFEYIYEPMDFNFAHMCNLGAANSKGEVLLFLNDDVTITSPNTLNVMFDEVCYTYVGAVGVKLLYPDTTKIQHAGVVSTRIGPVHKLQFMDDKAEHYYGYNRYVQNVLAVTGAAIMIRKEAYMKVGGMNEKLKVAFNDIDLCFKLYEKGYVNVVCNNISCEHAESITRGADTSVDALKRLLSEKDKLYLEHPMFRGSDPFYSKYLINDTLDARFVPGNEFDFKVSYEKPEVSLPYDISSSRQEPCITIGIEYAGLVSGYLYDYETNDFNKEDFCIQGYSFVSGSDNACYKKEVLLFNEKENEYISIPINGTIRSDVTNNCPNEVNVQRCGISLVIPRKSLKNGHYRIGISFDKMYAKERLYILSNRYIEIKS